MFNHKQKRKWKVESGLWILLSTFHFPLSFLCGGLLHLGAESLAFVTLPGPDSGFEVEAPPKAFVYEDPYTYADAQKTGYPGEKNPKAPPGGGFLDAVQNGLARVELAGGRFLLRFNAPGYYRVEAGGRAWSVFVSPVPSKHVTAGEDVDWYVTQFEGFEKKVNGWPEEARSNCGPALAAMGIARTSGKVYTAEALRKEMGWHDEGSVSFIEIADEMKRHGVNCGLKALSSPADLRKAIDADSAAVILLSDTKALSGSSPSPGESLFGRYYLYLQGSHFLLIKGYSLDGKWFIAYDPLPSDWNNNGFRYGDGVSRMGKNRYYNAEELFRKLRGGQMLVIPPGNR